jgi:hypothetical protein
MAGLGNRNSPDWQAPWYALCHIPGSIPRKSPIMQNDQSRTHRGVAYSVVRSQQANVWCWQFRIGDQLKSGKTEARLPLLAVRRVQMCIDRELRRITNETKN